MMLDGEQMRVYHTLAPVDCGEATNIHAFAILTGAAAAAAGRCADAADLGAQIAAPERERWAAILHLLLRLADAHTFGAVVDAGEIQSAAARLACLEDREE